MKRFFTWLPTLVLVIICSLFLFNSPSYAFNQADLDQLLQNNICEKCDLSDAELRDAELRDADLSNADLRGADLRDADLSNADLRGAELSNADLQQLRDLSGCRAGASATCAMLT